MNEKTVNKTFFLSLFLMGIYMKEPKSIYMHTTETAYSLVHDETLQWKLIQLSKYNPKTDMV